MNNYPKLHNAMWPGYVGKGTPDAEPAISFDQMFDMTCNAVYEGQTFDGIDIFSTDASPKGDLEEVDRFADRILARNKEVGSIVAPVWPPAGGGSAMGRKEERAQFVGQVRIACMVGQRLRERGARPNGVIRIDSAEFGIDRWKEAPVEHSKTIAETFREAADIAAGFGERLAAEGEICWAGMHTWSTMLDLLEQTDRPDTLGFQADMAHTLLYALGYNGEPQDRLVSADFNWEPEALDEAIRKLTARLRPWTIDFHVAQNDATVKGSGTHDKTGRHCLPNDPNGKLNIPHHAGFWLRDDSGILVKKCRSICWDGCMFPNEELVKPQTWNDILAVMTKVREAHGWND